MLGLLASQFIQNGGGKALLGGLLGGLGGSRGRAPMAYAPAQQMTDLGQRRDFSGRTLGYLGDMASGSKPLMSQAEIARQLSGSRARLNSDFATGAQRIAERDLGRQGRMGGMAEESLAELERQRLGDSRQLEAGVQNQLASQAPGIRLQAAGMGLGFVGNEQDRYLDEYHRQFAQDAARQQFSKGDNILGGALAGFQKAGGPDWLNGLMKGGGGSGGNTAPFAPWYGRDPRIPALPPPDLYNQGSPGQYVTL